MHCCVLTTFMCGNVGLPHLHQINGMNTILTFRTSGALLVRLGNRTVLVVLFEYNDLDRNLEIYHSNPHSRRSSVIGL